MVDTTFSQKTSFGLIKNIYFIFIILFLALSFFQLNYNLLIKKSEIEKEIEEETLEQKMLEKISIKEDVEPEEDVEQEEDIEEIKEVLEQADERTLKEVYNEMVSTNKRKTGLQGFKAWLGSKE